MPVASVDAGERGDDAGLNSDAPRSSGVRLGLQDFLPLQPITMGVFVMFAVVTHTLVVFNPPALAAFYPPLVPQVNKKFR
jgi:hypothetical protein